MVRFIIIFSGALTPPELDTDWSLAVLVNFLLVAVAVGTIGAEQYSQEGEQIGMFYFCKYFLLAQLLLFLFCDGLFSVFYFCS